jgi:predicted RNA-binding Zn-ribbon protein involved in translation (DUF1610 family)
MFGTLLARFDSIGEAESARSALEAVGIEAVLADENLVAINWLYANAVGSIKLLVHEEDREQSLSVLGGEIQDGMASSEVEPDSAEAESVSSQDDRACPSCGSTDVKRLARLKLFALVAGSLAAIGYAVNQWDFALIGVIVTAIVFTFAPSHQCAKCGERWNAPEEAGRSFESPPPDPSDTIEELCPRCGSAEVHHINYRRLKAVPLLLNVTILLMVPVWLALPKRRCDQCGLKI